MLFAIEQTPCFAQSFYFGADLSYVNEMEDCGAIYKVNNSPVDPYQVFSDSNANLIRLRLWHTPRWYDNLNQGNRYSDFQDVRQSILRAKSAGMDVLLDFHLSDTWADPSHQVAPSAWTSVLGDLPVLQDSLYNYIYSTLEKLANEDLLPELVQIGNETNREILLSQEVNDAGWTLDWNRNGPLFNTAIKAVRDIETTFQSEIKIAIHIAGPADVYWYIDQFVDHGVTDFDIIGISYYWQWHEQTFDEVGSVISTLKQDFPGKEVMIFETAYPWTSTNADAANNILSVAYPGLAPHSPAHQQEWIIGLTQAVIDNGGKGVIYWEPAWVSTGCRTLYGLGSHWDNATFFNSNEELISNGGIRWMTHPYDFILATKEPEDYRNQIEIFQAGEELIIKKNNGSNLNASLTIQYFSLEGKMIHHHSFFPSWEKNTIRILLPEILPGSYMVTLISEDHSTISKMIFKQ